MTTPLNNLTDTWNSGGSTLYGLKYNITNTASGVGSRLIEFEVGGSPRFNVDTSGTAFFGNTTSSLTLNNSATDPAFVSATGSILFTGGTVTANKPVINATQEWNSGAITFTGLKLNITNTASAAASLLLDFQISGSSIFSVGKDALLTLNNTNQIKSGTFFSFGVTNSFAFSIFNSANVYFANSVNVWFNSSGNSSEANNPDVAFVRSRAQTIGVRNGTTAQSFDVYNTFTDSSNYERGVFDWTTTANTLTIGTQKQGTGTARNIFLVSAAANAAITGRTGVNASWLFTDASGTVPVATVFYQSYIGILSTMSFAISSSSTDVTAGVDTGMSRSAAGVVAFGNGSTGDASATILTKTKAGAFTTSDIPAGTWIVGRDTSGATTKLYYNNAGTLMVVALV